MKSSEANKKAAEHSLDAIESNANEDSNNRTTLVASVTHFEKLLALQNSMPVSLPKLSKYEHMKCVYETLHYEHNQRKQYKVQTKRI